MRIRDVGFVLLGLGCLGTACSAEKDALSNLPPPGAGRDGGTNTGDGDFGSPGDGDNPVGDGDGDYGSGDPNEPVYIDDCAAGSGTNLTAEQVTSLKAGGAASGTRMLYPYDGTVFPRGLQGPLLMWESASKAEGVYVRITAKNFEYEGCLKPTADNQLQLPEKVWKQAGVKTRGSKEPFAVEVTTLAGGKASGPLKQNWVIAQATIKGSIYYNSYFSIETLSPLGKIFRIPPGGKFEAVTGIDCNGCHSVSANGARMTGQTLGLGGRAWDIETTPVKNMPNPTSAAYAALLPDGSRYVRGAATPLMDVARTATASLFGSVTVGLFETDTNMEIPNHGIPPGVMMPSFSADGKLLVFNDQAINNAHGLAVMQFDEKTNKATDYKKIYTDTTYRPGWPFLLPDNQGVVFVRTDGTDFSGNGAGVFSGLLADLGPYSELFMVDVDSGKSTLAARAMGYATVADAEQGKTYLPFGKDDTRRVYFPTVSPVAAGGYFWVFFDAIRHYGNLGQQRALWGTAIEISPTGDYSIDRSAPAFYLPGQEFNTGNHRAFTALDPCKEDGTDCTSGVDCCGGYCEFPPGGEFDVDRVGKCASTAKECARVDERCTTSTDCCVAGEGQPSNECIAGFCSSIVLL